MSGLVTTRSKLGAGYQECMRLNAAGAFGIAPYWPSRYAPAVSASAGPARRSGRRRRDGTAELNVGPGTRSACGRHACFGARRVTRDSRPGVSWREYSRNARIYTGMKNTRMCFRAAFISFYHLQNKKN